MSKISQDQWEAIAQRYSSGETLSSIARHYGCTPPAIHYILKQVKKLKTDTAVSQVVARPQGAAQAESQRRPDAPRTNQIPSPIDVAEGVLSRPQPLPLRHPRDERGGRHATLPAASGQNGRPTAAAPKPLGAGRAPALTADLDTELQAYGETAIQEFRSSFAATLAEGSPASRARLRQAAANLMRVGARTTIVLDRLNAGIKPTRFGMTD
jgi:transposase-like protein